MKRISLIVIAVVLGASVNVASAQDEARAEAQKFFRAGESAFNAGQYEIAAQAFEEAFKVLPLAAIAFSTAQAYRLQYFIDKDPRRLKRAIELYRWYIKETPKGGRRDDAVGSLAELGPVLARLEDEQRRQGRGPIASGMGERKATTQLMISTQVSGAKAAIDKESPGETPVIRDVSEGPHDVSVTAEGYFPATQTATAVRGRLVVVEVELKPMPAVVALRVEGGALVSIDGRVAGTTPFARPLELEAGKHLITVSKRGRHIWGQEVEVKRGEELALDVSLRTTGQRKGAYGVMLGAGVTYLAAGVYAFLTLSADGDASDLLDVSQTRALTVPELADYAGFVDKRDDRLRTTYVLAGVGTALAATGVLMYLIDTPSGEMPSMMGSGAPALGASKKVSVLPTLDRDGFGLGLAGRF